MLLEDTYEALLGAGVPMPLAPSSPISNCSDVQQAAESAAAAAAIDKDKKDLEVVELLVPGVIDDLVDSTDLDEEVRKFFF